MVEVNKSQAIRDYYKANPKATTQEVVDALAKNGITVAAGLVRNVKTKHNQRQAAEKGAKTAATSETTTNGVNKTQAVRDYLKANKKAKAQEVVDALAEQVQVPECGVVCVSAFPGDLTFTENLVYKIIRSGAHRSWHLRTLSN